MVVLREGVRRLLRLRVPQILGAYLAGGWGLLQFVEWLADRHIAPAGLVNVLLVAWILLLPVALLIVWRRDVGEAVEEPIRAPRSVAVLPFANLSPGPGDAYLSDGISDEIITALARVEGLRVASRTSSFLYRDGSADIRTVGRELNVRAVLEGTVQRVGGQLRVTTQLVDAVNGYQLWSAHFDSEMEDVFAIEDDIAENVVRVLRVLLRGQDWGALPRIPRADVRAYECYMRGRQFFHRTLKKSLGYAREMFTRAIEIDPDYALAHAALADTISVERMYYLASDVDLARADEESRRALALDPLLAEAHSARGTYLFLAGCFDEAEDEFRTAQRLDPGLFDAYYFYARMCFQLGRMQDAARLFEQACHAREDYQAAYFAAQSFEALGQEAEAQCSYARALEIVERHMELNPDDPRAATMRAVSLCRLGRRDEGLAWAEQAMIIDPDDAGVRYNAACLFSVAGDAERAIACLEEAVDVGFGNRDWLEHDPDMAPLRDDPRFQALLRRM